MTTRVRSSIYALLLGIFTDGYNLKPNKYEIARANQIWPPLVRSRHWFPASQALPLLFADSLSALFARRDSFQNMCVYMFTNAFICVVSHNSKNGSVHGNTLLGRAYLQLTVNSQKR